MTTLSWNEISDRALKFSRELATAAEEAAQYVLYVRKDFPSATLADLYNPVAMPPELVKAHAALDKGVDRCYRERPFRSDRERVEYLFELYEELTSADSPNNERWVTTWLNQLVT